MIQPTIHNEKITAVYCRSSHKDRWFFPSRCLVEQKGKLKEYAKEHGLLNEERFLKMSRKYEDEQVELTQKLKHLKALVEKDQTHEMNADGFLKLVRKYTKVNKLTPEILNEVIDQIVVHHRQKIYGQVFQKIEIHYRMIGQVEVPLLDEVKQYKKSFARNKKEDCIAV